jgi:hypothetical protein
MNPTLAGFRVYGHDQKYRDAMGLLKKRRMKPGEYSEVIAEAHEPLITPLQHAKVQALMYEHADRKQSGLLRGYVRELTRLVLCSHCGRHMAYQHHVRLGPVYLRCSYFQCPAARSNRIKVQTVKDAIWAKLKDQREQLVAYAMANNGIKSGQLDEAVELEQQIRELEERQDPDLKQVILRKRLKLEGVLQMHGHRLDVDLSTQEMRRLLENEAGWEQMKTDPVATRGLFVMLVDKVLVRDRAVEAVMLRLDQCGAMGSLGLG